MRVLIVEDERDFADLLREIIEDAGYECAGAASSVEEAVAAAAVARPDVVLLDLCLQGPMIGIEAAQIIRRARPHVSLVFVTGYSDPSVVEATTRLRPVAYLVKPVTHKQLTAALVEAEAEQRDRPRSSKRGGPV